MNATQQTTATILASREDWELLDIRSDARRHADRYGTESEEELARIELSMRYRAYMEATAELRRAKVRMFADATLGVPFIVEPGKPPRLADWSMGEGALECIRLLDEMIASEAKRYGLEFSASPSDAPQPPVPPAA
jgi:hypothetical protein